MPWFWGRKSKDDDDDEEEWESASSEDDDEEESYSSEEEEQHSGDEDEDEATDEHEEEEGEPHSAVGGEAVVVASNNEEAVHDGDDSGPPSSDTPLGIGQNLPKGGNTNDGLGGDDKEGSSSSSTSSSIDPHENVREYQVELNLVENGARSRTTRDSSLLGRSNSKGSRHSRSSSEDDDDDNVSMIESDGLHSGDEGYLDTTSDEDDGVSNSSSSSRSRSRSEDDDSSSLEAENDNDEAPPRTKPSSAAQSEVVRVETVDENESESDYAESESEDEKGDDDEEEEGPTSFWEKQSLLALAAEHDRVDILKGILSDDDQDASALMDSGIPPLHIAISFGSTNTTQSLLRMGADPSIRPNVSEVRKQAQEAPEGSKLEIPNMARFDGVSAWELAFGNQAYEEHQKNRSSWSMFNSSTSSLSLSTSANNIGAADRIIKPCDMAPSKREGIRHAFTAEALRCIGGDEVERLEKLLDSGMPASIDIGGKDLYDWAVQLGGMKCEEFLRPSEAAKHGTGADRISGENVEQETSATPVRDGDGKGSSTAGHPASTGKVLDRPGGEITVSALINRLDELESLASALSTCLDNLAEEVSVCHGLLLMGGGASALASHVKSLKNMQDQKQTQLMEAYAELQEVAQELSKLVTLSGPIGQEIVAMAPTTLARQDYSRTESFRNAQDGGEGDDDSSHKRQQLLAQIAASENKILKLRASIADLSEENAKEMEQVERRGLTGGINLVRTLREELRDLEFQWNETKNRIATCRAQIGMIHSRIPRNEPKTAKSVKPAPTSADTEDSKSSILDDEGIVMVGGIDGNEIEGNDLGEMAEDVVLLPVTNHSGDESHPARPSSAISKEKVNDTAPAKGTVDRPTTRPALPGHVEIKRKENGQTPPSAALPTTTESQRIATGDSQALIVRPSGKRGYFTVDLWQVLLRIIGFDQAANRRGAEVAKKQKGSTANVMIV